MDGKWSAAALGLLWSAGAAAAQMPDEPRAELLPPREQRRPETLPTPRPVQKLSWGYGPLDVELGLVPPSADALFRAETEGQFLERLRREALQQKITLMYPPVNTLQGTPLPVLIRNLPPEAVGPVPEMVCYHPLYFEVCDTERFGWFVPYLQPALSTAEFYWDTLLLPYHMAVQPPWTWECDNMRPAPGDKVD